MKSPISLPKFLALSLMFLLLSLCPRSAQAHADIYPLIGLGVGWENMILKSDDYKNNNSGLMFTLTLGAGAGGLGKKLGFQLEQDLGFLDLELKEDQEEKGGAKKELSIRRFKGATLAGFHGQFGFNRHYSSLLFSPKLDIGAVYMKTPEGVEKSVQGWFAIRPSISLDFCISEVLPCLGLEFDYTLGLSSPNVFDHSRVTHFVSLKLKIQFNSNI